MLDPQDPPQSVGSVCAANPLAASLDRQLADAVGAARTESERLLISELRSGLGRPGVSIPTVPEAITRLHWMFGARSQDVSAIAQSIAAEPDVARRVLAVVQRPVDPSLSDAQNIERAVTHIGLPELRNVVLAVACRGSVFRIPGRRRLTTELYRHAITTAQAAKIVGSGIGQEASNAFLAGLIHDLGRVLVHRAAVSVVRSSGGRRQPGQAMVEALADEIHEPLGALLASQWGLPNVIIEAVRWHHEPNAAPEAARPMAKAVQAGDLLADQLELSSPVQDIRRLDALETAGMAIELTPHIIEKLSVQFSAYAPKAARQAPRAIAS